jgi:holo-[acyl-carrier protein] synthase
MDMTIIGLGLDVTEISRIQYMLERYGARFHDRIYTSGEIAYCRRRRDQASSFAARFAAKEAGMKALGTGRSRGVLWRDIEVVRTFGPPQLQFHGGAARRFSEMRGTRALLTLTHSGQLAIAQVILIGG